MRVVLTRPAADAGGWSQALRERGYEVLCLPLLEIGPAPDREALDRAWVALATAQAAMFVSGNAVRGLLAGRQDGWPTPVRAWSTGPGTSRALLEHGVPAACIDAPPGDSARFDSEALWDRVGASVRPGVPVWIVRGADAQGRIIGRDWLAGRLLDAGVPVHEVAAYTRTAAAWSVQQRASAMAAAGDGSVWLLSSSEAVRVLRDLLPGADWSRARAIASHVRIADAAREAGFGVVCPSRAGEDGMIAALESFG